MTWSCFFSFFDLKANHVMVPFILMREFLKALAVAFPLLSLATQRCFDQRNSATSASAICPSIITMFLLPEVISFWHKGITQGHKEARSFQKYTCFLSSSRGFRVIFRLWHILTCTSTRLVNNCRLAPKKTTDAWLQEQMCWASLHFLPSVSFWTIRSSLLHKPQGHTHTAASIRLHTAYRNTKPLHFVCQIYKYFVFTTS